MRKTNTVTIDTEGRDKGKTFFIREMAAVPAEKWAMRALSAMGRAGVPIPADLENSGMAGIAAAGVRSLVTMDFADAEELLDEMMRCVQFMPDPSKPDIVRPLVDAGPDGEGADIEEVATRLRLRSEVIALHLGFSIADALSKLGALAKLKLGNISNMSTSRDQSEPSSPPSSPA